jgi:hypothetical protein
VRCREQSPAVVAVPSKARPSFREVIFENGRVGLSFSQSFSRYNCHMAHPAGDLHAGNSAATSVTNDAAGDSATTSVTNDAAGDSATASVTNDAAGDSATASVTNDTGHFDRLIDWGR